MAHTTVTRNKTGFKKFGVGGVFESRGDNNLRGNTANKDGTVTTYAPE